MLADATNPVRSVQSMMAAVSGCSCPEGCIVAAASPPPGCEEEEGEAKRSGKSRLRSLPPLRDEGCG